MILGNDIEKATFLRNQDAIKYISDSHPQYNSQISQAIKNSSKFSINGEINKDVDGSSFLTLYLRNKKGEVVTSVDFDNIKDVDNFKTIISKVWENINGPMADHIMVNGRLIQI